MLPCCKPFKNGSTDAGLVASRHSPTPTTQHNQHTFRKEGLLSNTTEWPQNSHRSACHFFLPPQLPPNRRFLHFPLHITRVGPGFCFRYILLRSEIEMSFYHFFCFELTKTLQILRLEVTWMALTNNTYGHMVCNFDSSDKISKGQDFCVSFWSSNSYQLMGFWILAKTWILFHHDFPCHILASHICHLFPTCLPLVYLFLCFSFPTTLHGYVPPWLQLPFNVEISAASTVQARREALTREHN